MTARARFTKADVKRAIAGAREAGIQIGSVEIDPVGAIRIVEAATTARSRGNSCDDLLRAS